jgi:DUF4097 and DUF4098 domain-containing protein YvlB
MRTVLFATVALFAVAPAAHAQRDESRQKVDTTFAFAKGGSVDLGLVSGEIIVTGWTKQEVKIYASIETGYFDASFSSSRVSITARSRRNRMSEARYEVSVPIGTEVRASAVSGDIAVRGTAGETLVNSISGNVEVRDAQDHVELHTVSGDIRASKLRGRIRANSVSGDFVLDDVVGDLQAKTVSGELRVRGSLSGFEFSSVSGDFDFAGDIKGDGSYSANTHSGDVRLTLPSNTGATLDLQTFSGEVRPGFPLTLQPGDQPLNRRNRRQRFTVNGGGPRITLETFSGDIIIERGAARAPKED